MKRIAVVLSERHSEGLRMAAGLSLLDDRVDIYLLDNDFNIKDMPVIEKNLDMIRMVGIGLYSNFKKEGFDFIETAELGRRFLKYDYVIPY